MRTSLTGHIDSGRTSLGDKRNAGSAADMNDVKPAAGFRRNIDRAADRLELGGDGSRIQVVANSIPVRGASGASQRARYFFRFSVDRDKEIEFGGAFHSVAQDRQIDVREIADAAIAHERFQSDGAAIAERFQVRQVARNEPTP